MNEKRSLKWQQSKARRGAVSNFWRYTGGEPTGKKGKQKVNKGMKNAK
jgi:hypothetical protein